MAVQEYGVPNRELITALRQRGAVVTAVPVYQWALPEDTQPLRDAVEQIAAGRVDVMLITSATQVEHLMQIAGETGKEGAVREGLRGAVVASIGPISSQALAAHGITADFEPSHPRMGQLVLETAQRARRLLQKKRASDLS
jgi:uroporphyrinogen-III synthase